MNLETSYLCLKSSHNIYKKTVFPEPVGADVIGDLGKQKVRGSVQRIEKNELGDGVYVIIKTKSGKEFKIEGSRISRVSKPSTDDDTARLSSSPALFNESRFKTYNDFLKD